MFMKRKKARYIELDHVLNTALKSVRSTLILGSSNHKKNQEKTGKFIGFALDRFDSHTAGGGTFVTYDYNKKIHDSKVNWKLKKQFSHNQSHLFFKNKDKSSESEYLLGREKENYSKKVALGYYVRAGNCNTHAHLIADHLWAWQQQHSKNKLINRIEIVSLEDFDHVVVLINRAPRSSLEEPSTWHCKVIDAWQGADIKHPIYSSDKFNEKMEKAYHALRGKEYDVLSHDFAVEADVVITPLTMPYSEAWKTADHYGIVQQDIEQETNARALTKETFLTQVAPDIQKRNAGAIRVDMHDSEIDSEQPACCTIL